jgi:hypothetical protein
MKDGDLHVLCTKISTPLHTMPEGRRRAGEPPRLQECRCTKVQDWFTLEPQHKATSPCSCTLSRAKPSTYTHKDVLRTKDLITKHLDGLEKFLGVGVTSRDSSNSKMARVRHLNSPPSQASRLEPLCLFLRRRQIIIRVGLGSSDLSETKQ